MAKTAIILSVLGLLIMSSSIVRAQQITQPPEDEIKAVLLAQQDAWNRGDLAGYMEGYWKSDSLLFTSGGNVRRGWKVTFEKYKSSYSTKEKMGELKFSDLEVTMLSTGAASVFGRWELTRKGDHPEGVFTLILKKIPEGWKVIHDHTSSLESPTKK